MASKTTLPFTSVQLIPLIPKVKSLSFSRSSDQSQLKNFTTATGSSVLAFTTHTPPMPSLDGTSGVAPLETRGPGSTSSTASLGNLSGDQVFTRFMASWVQKPTLLVWMSFCQSADFSVHMSTLT